jgi:hypothetical protein
VNEAHVSRYFESFRGDLGVLGIVRSWRETTLTSFEAVGEAMRAKGPSAHGFVMMLWHKGLGKKFVMNTRVALELKFLELNSAWVRRKGKEGSVSTY